MSDTKDPIRRLAEKILKDAIFEPDDRYIGYEGEAVEKVESILRREGVRVNDLRTGVPVTVHGRQCKIIDGPLFAVEADDGRFEVVDHRLIKPLPDAAEEDETHP